MYHLELRQFPHNLCRFNLDDQELRAIVEPWMREPWVEIEGQKWLPHQARLKILEGPRIPLSQLTMGRGWRTAERQGRDVTDLVLAAAKQAAAPPPPAPSETAPPTAAPSTSLPTQPAQPDSALVADSLGLELLALLAGGPAPLSAAWRRAAERYSERTPSESLELAERAVRSLLQARLIVLTGPPAKDGDGQPRSRGEPSDLEEGQVEPLLRALDSWRDHREPPVQMRRA